MKIYNVGFHILEDLFGLAQRNGSKRSAMLGYFNNLVESKGRIMEILINALSGFSRADRKLKNLSGTWGVGFITNSKYV